VDVSNHLAQVAFPTVVPDDSAIGKLAAEYLMDLGLKHFAFAGFSGLPFSELRQQSFAATLHKAGFEVAVLHLVNSTELLVAGTPGGSALEPGTWMQQLPKPTGLFAANDSVGMRLLEVCRQRHLSVPDALCVLGVDDDELIARISHPPLSSIPIFGRKVGFEAAHLLDDLMSGRHRKSLSMVLPPGGVVARQSTNLLAIPDPDILAAVQFIRDNIHKHITVGDVLQQVPVNRRYLERKFWHLMGRTPLQEIRRVRLEQAKHLLVDTDLSMPNIARRSGFRNAGRMASVFHQMIGLTPTRFRRQFRLDDRG